MTIGFILFAQFSYATAPVQVPLPPDDFPLEPPTQAHRPSNYPSASATINETELAVYFDFPVGVATIMVYDASNQVIYQESIDTDTNTEVFIPVAMWESGDYTLSVFYYSTTQRGNFNIQ